MVGGIVGNGNTGTIEINECKNYGTIDIKDNRMAYSGMGGIIGVGAGASVLKNCENYGTIGKEDTTEYAGGIIGVINNQMEINNCSNFGKVTSKTVGTGEEATTFYSIPFVMDEVVSGFKTEVIIKPDDSDYGTDAPYYLSNDQKYYVNVLDSGVVDEAKGVYAVTVDDYAIFPGQAVGGPEGTSFAQFYVTYRVVGENGNTAYLETTIGVLWDSTTGEILE